MKTKRIMIVAVGGQGNILAARVLGEAAAASGIPFRMSEFHGMAQRGGVVESMARHVNQLITLDATSLALQSGSVQAANMVMLGALAGSNILPIAPKTFRDMIRTKTKPQFTEINLIAFDLGTFAVNFSNTG